MIIASLLGLVLGFLGSIPIAGPVSALVFRAGLEGRLAEGRSIAYGASVAEAGYACLAFWGFNRYLSTYPMAVAASRAVAGLMLVALGVLLLRHGAASGSGTKGREASAKRKGLALGFTITALNPTLIATWTVVAGSVHSLSGGLEPGHALPFSAGVGLGIALWFVLMLALLDGHRHRLGHRSLAMAGRAIALTLAGLGLWLLATSFATLAPGLR